MHYSVASNESLSSYEERFGDIQDDFKLPKPPFVKDSTTRASSRGTIYRSTRIRRVTIDTRERDQVERLDPAVHRRSLDQIMDYLQRVGETALIHQDPLTLLQLDIPPQKQMHPDRFRYIEGVQVR